ncbi:hypothetical protein V5799_003810 [Amblyomma americanum]|uniref:Peptidase M13 N-terminal domain-containing protein n=1 Tax=Amblyomma americanum TaxID=6943 RepID=A0AAQ4D7X3_AMBAM
MSKQEGKEADGDKQERRLGPSADPWTSPAASTSSRINVATEGAADAPEDAGVSAPGIRRETCAVVVTEQPHVEYAEAPVAGSIPGGQGPALTSMRMPVSSDGAVSKPTDIDCIILKARPEPCTVPFTQKLLADPAGVPVTGTVRGDRDPVRASSRTTVSSESAAVKPADAITLNVTGEPSAAAFSAKPLDEYAVALAAAAVPGEQEPGPVSSRTTVYSDSAAGKPVDVSTIAVEALHEPCPARVTNKPQAEIAQAPAAGTVQGQEQPRRYPGEVVHWAPTSPAAVKQNESPLAATAAIRPEAPIPKTTGKRGQSDKRGSQRRRGTARDSAAKSPKGTGYPKSVASPQAREDIQATSIATSGATSYATSGAASPAAIAAANAFIVGTGSQKGLLGSSAAASGATSPATITATLAATGAAPSAVASVRQEVLKEGFASKHRDQSAVEAALPSSGTTATREQQCRSEAVPTGVTAGNDPMAQVDYQVAAAATPGPRMNVRTSESQSTKSSELIKRPKCDLTKTEMWITVAFFGACISLFLFMVFLIGILRQPTINQALCFTEDCDRHAILLTKYLNRTLDPCEDYAAFVCSAWEPAKAHIELARSAIDDLRFAWYKHFMDTLASGSLKISAGRKPLAMYDMCLRKFPYSASQMALIRDILHSQGLSWPEPPAKLQPPLSMFVAFSYKWLMSFWITVYVRHPRPSARRHVFVSPGLYLPILLNHHRSVARSYARYWQQFLILFYPDIVDRPPMDEKHINEIRIMEEDILTRLYQAVKSSRKKPALFSFKDIGARLQNASSNEWVQDFQAGLLLDSSLTADDQIVTDVTFLATVAELLLLYTTKQLNIHITWLIMQYLTIAGDYSVLVRYYGSLETADKLLPMFCAHHVEVVFNVLVSALGFFSRFTARDREAIDTGFNSLVSAAVDRINNSSWLDNESKIRARKKLSSVRAAIWPPTSLLNNETLEKIYADFPEKEPSYAHYWFKGRKAATAVNMTQGYDEALMLLGNHFPVYADYNYVYNVVKLAMATASPPAFYRNGTKGMLYGGLLFIMAMQLARAIDGEGIQWSANRTADENTILSSFSLQEFHAREKCQHGEGSSSVFPEVPAVEITYAALTASHFRDADQPMGIASDLPERKVFFMTLCYMACASPGAQNVIAADCNKVVRNSDVFAEVYGCRKGSNMNPVKKCSFFN